jgi:O-antigen/teichoic acid export membrane protein
MIMALLVFRMNEFRKQSQSNLKKIVQGSGINFVGSVGRQISGFIFIWIIARYLTKDQLGLYFLAFNIIMFLAVVCLAGTENGLIRFVSIYDGEGDRLQIWNSIFSAFLLVIPFSILCGIGLFYSANFISITFFKKPSLEMAIKGLALFLPLFTFCSVSLSATQGKKLMHYKVLCMDISNNLLKIVIVLILFMLGLKLSGAVASTTISITAAAFLSGYFFFKVFNFPIELKNFGSNFKAFLSFSLPQSFSNILNRSVGMIDTILLGYFSAITSVGIYNIALKIALLGTLLLSSFNTMVAPIIADLHNKNNLDELERTYKTVTRWIFTISFPIFAFLIGFPGHIMEIFGITYSVGAFCLIIICLGQLVNASTGPSGLMILMSGHPYINLFNNFISFTIMVTLDVTLIPKYGLLGAAFGLTISLVVVNILRVAQVLYLLKMQPYDLIFLKPIIATTISLAIVIGLSKWFSEVHSSLILIILCSIYILGYLFGLYFLKVNEVDLYLLRKIKSHIFSQ